MDGGIQALHCCTSTSMSHKTMIAQIKLMACDVYCDTSTIIIKK